ncbi:hypothetical protein Acsp01_28440 [Actinoplanes sp. NBRC 101535]|nr:hypothetical protein Acsp01_28440 [Actinoplanes sp. NBRC 101535]
MPHYGSDMGDAVRTHYQNAINKGAMLPKTLDVTNPLDVWSKNLSNGTEFASARERRIFLQDGLIPTRFWVDRGGENYQLDDPFHEISSSRATAETRLAIRHEAAVEIARAQQHHAPQPAYHAGHQAVPQAPQHYAPQPAYYAGHQAVPQAQQHFAVPVILDPRVAALRSSSSVPAPAGQSLGTPRGTRVPFGTPGQSSSSGHNPGR